MSQKPDIQPGLLSRVIQTRLHLSVPDDSILSSKKFWLGVTAVTLVIAAVIGTYLYNSYAREDPVGASGISVPQSQPELDPELSDAEKHAKSLEVRQAYPWAGQTANIAGAFTGGKDWFTIMKENGVPPGDFAPDGIPPVGDNPIISDSPRGGDTIIVTARYPQGWSLIIPVKVMKGGSYQILGVSYRGGYT